MRSKKHKLKYKIIVTLTLFLIGAITSTLTYFISLNPYFNDKIKVFIEEVYRQLLDNFEFYIPKILFAFFILLAGLGISILTYKFIFYLFKRFNIVELIDRLTIEFSDNLGEEIFEKKLENETIEKNIEYPIKKLSQKIKIDKIVAKASAYYVFLLFFRLSIYKLNIVDIEVFLTQLINYLPNLFIGFLIGFFGVRFSDFIYDIIYYTLDLSGQKTSKTIASGGKMIVLFFTIITVLDKVGITTDITNTILTGFIAMLSVAGGIAFGLGGKDVAKEVLESLKK